MFNFLNWKTNCFQQSLEFINLGNHSKCKPNSSSLAPGQSPHWNCMLKILLFDYFSFHCSMGTLILNSAVSCDSFLCSLVQTDMIHRISSIDSTVWALFWHLIKKVLILKNFFMAMSLLNVGFISLDCFLCMLSLYWCEGILLSCSLIRNSFSFSSSSVCIHVLLKSIVLLCVKPAAFLLA